MLSDIRDQGSESRKEKRKKYESVRVQEFKKR